MRGTAKQIASAFAALAARHGLRLVSQIDGDRESDVTFASDRVELRVNSTAGADLSVRLGQRGGLLFGLCELAELAGEELAWPSGTPAALARAVALTAQHGAALLGGDFSSFPELGCARAVRRRRERVARFGTSTGETPRFDHRPTLEALFADATGELLTTARAYQAIWDYEYTLEEVGRHLGEPVARVRDRLDEWDRLG